MDTPNLTLMRCSNCGFEEPVPVTSPLTGCYRCGSNKVTIFPITGGVTGSNSSVKDTSWQQDTPTQSENDPSKYHGIPDLAKVISSIYVQHYRVAGICSNLLASFPPNIGTEILERQAEVCASFAKLIADLEDLQQHAISASKRSAKLSTNKTE